MELSVRSEPRTIPTFGGQDGEEQGKKTVKGWAASDLEEPRDSGSWEPAEESVLRKRKRSNRLQFKEEAIHWHGSWQPWHTWSWWDDDGKAWLKWAQEGRGRAIGLGRWRKNQKARWTLGNVMQEVFYLPMARKMYSYYLEQKPASLVINKFMERPFCVCTFKENWNWLRLSSLSLKDVSNKSYVNYCICYVLFLDLKKTNEFHKNDYQLFWVHIIPGIFLDTLSHRFI